jgi:hypothetical protein
VKAVSARIVAAASFKIELDEVNGMMTVRGEMDTANRREPPSLYRLWPIHIAAHPLN